jgi:hypothetical protein
VKQPAARVQRAPGGGVLPHGSGVCEDMTRIQVFDDTAVKFTLANGDVIQVSLGQRMSADGYFLEVHSHAHGMQPLLILPQSGNAAHLFTGRSMEALNAEVARIVTERKRRTGS